MKETHHAPEKWARCSLGDIVVLNPKNDATAEQKAGFVPMALAPTDYHGTLQYEEKLWGEIKKSYTNFADGDVIFAKVTPCFENGKAAIVRDLPSGIGAGSSEFYVLRPLGKEVSPNLLFAIIKTQSFMQQGAENMTGAVGLRRVPRAFVESFPVALPPAAEQKVIADKLDTLLAQVENTKARLERIPQILKRFRQSVLAAAVSGRLTEEWSCTNAELREIAEFQNGYAFKSGWFENSGTHQVVKLGNIRDGHIALENSPAYVGEELANEFSRYAPSPGDILISMTGTRFKKDYGFACMIKNEKDLLVNQRVGRIIPDRSKVSSEYLSLFVRSDVFRDQFFEGETGGVNQGNVGSKHILSILVELPTIDIQSEIVRRVDQLFAHADRIEQQVNNALARVNNLTQSILAKAFRGELTEEWRKDNPELVSGDNSAEALLDRIKAERAAQQPIKKTRAGKASH